MLQNVRHHQQAVHSLKPPADAQAEPQWHQPTTILGGHYLTDCAFYALGADAICTMGADAVKGLVPGTLPNIAPAFRRRQQEAPPLRPPACARVESRWKQPLPVSGGCLSTRL